MLGFRGRRDALAVQHRISGGCVSYEVGRSLVMPAARRVVYDIGAVVDVSAVHRLLELYASLGHAVAQLVPRGRMLRRPGSRILFHVASLGYDRGPRVSVIVTVS